MIYWTICWIIKNDIFVLSLHWISYLKAKMITLKLHQHCSCKVQIICNDAQIAAIISARLSASQAYFTFLSYTDITADLKLLRQLLYHRWAAWSLRADKSEVRARTGSCSRTGAALGNSEGYNITEAFTLDMTCVSLTSLSKAGAYCIYPTCHLSSPLTDTIHLSESLCVSTDSLLCSGGMATSSHASQQTISK